LGVCLGDMVASMVYSRLGDKKYKELTEVDLLKEARQLVVKNRNKLVHRLKLATMVQCGDEHITSFETRLKPVARIGRFQVEWVACKERLTTPTRWCWTT
jgi:bacterioferritin (cytochrome b1)